MHDLGDPITLSFVTSEGGSTVNPTTVTLTLTQPDGTTLLPAVTTTSVGHHQVVVTPTQAGRHVFRWAATGAGARTHMDVFNVREATSQALVSITDVKAHLNKNDDVDDEELRRTAEAATGVVERYRREIVARRSFTEEFRATSSTRFLVGHYPVDSVTSLVRVDGSTTYDPANLVVDSSTGLVTVGSGPALSGHLRVVYVAGYVVVPPEFLEATAIIAAYLWGTQQQPGLGPRGPFATDDTVAPPGMGFVIPRAAADLLGGRAPIVA
jgi:hypothetical protein